MKEFWHWLVSNLWWAGWFIGAIIGSVAAWVTNVAESIGSAFSRRYRRKVAHRQELRALELEAKRRELEEKYPRPVKPECGCGHHYSFHNAETGRCHWRKEHPTGKKVPEECSCQRYTGPEPLPTYYDPLSGP